ncbi:hypothetical protein MHB59_12155 [Bacillus sp. FSL L8-0642]|uniref:hypothetical protein n=1 Tax=Bacillus TaxID=1386 RepID=UPI0007DAE961|nr:hypothetical protein [Bacillus wiedmannii]OAK38976.1 hypothetical protein A6286_06600 [Bacillus wiedmannii]
MKEKRQVEILIKSLFDRKVMAMNRVEWITAILEIVRPYLNDKDFEQVALKTTVLLAQELIDKE